VFVRTRKKMAIVEHRGTSPSFYECLSASPLRCFSCSSSRPR
jgi:hypothetical protein